MKEIKAKIKRYSKMSLTAMVVAFFGTVLISVLALFVRRRKKRK